MKKIFACGLASASFLPCHALAIPPSVPVKQVTNFNLHNLKYFNEAGPTILLGHYDSRYYPGHTASQEVTSESLHHLTISYHDYLEALNISTWLAHGTLLGWFWNGKVLPWDSDLDMQVWADDLFVLAGHNMTVYDYRTIIEPAARKTLLTTDWQTPKPPQPVEFQRKYLLDVNPHHVDRSSADRLNVIDARWIDTVTGLFIDITGLSDAGASGAGTRADGNGGWTCKNRHKYPKTQLSRETMVPTMFEGRRALVPRAYRNVLVREYGAGSLVNKEFEGYIFLQETGEWMMNDMSKVH